MQLARIWLALGLLLMLAACQNDRQALIFVISNPPERAMATEVTELVSKNSTLEFEIIAASPGESPGDYLADGRGDLAFASNDLPSMPGLSSTVPLYTSVLHILYPADVNPSSLTDLLNHNNKFTGEKNSSTEGLVKRIGELSGLDPATVQSTTTRPPHTAEVIFLLGPINDNTRRMTRGRHFFSLGDPAELGNGTMAEGISIRIAQARPYTIPAYAYGPVTPEPILALAVDTHIVMRQQLPEQAAYSFTRALVENKARFSQSNPSLFEGIRENFDRTTLTFPLHPGVQRFLDRDEPTVLERYAEVANVGVYILIILITTAAAFLRWNTRRKKDRADVYYQRVLSIRAKIPTANTSDKVHAISEVQSIYDEAFEKLIDERLAANESFQILIELCNDTLRELEKTTIEPRGIS